MEAAAAHEARLILSRSERLPKRLLRDFLDEHTRRGTSSTRRAADTIGILRPGQAFTTRAAGRNVWASINIPVRLFEELCSRSGGARVQQLQYGEVPMLRAPYRDAQACDALNTVAGSIRDAR